MKIISLFSWAGGLDLWFKKAGFNTIWANEYDKSIWETFEYNHRKTILDKRSIVNISASEIPDCVWIIWWPPCQSWSEAWSGRWIKDKRGQLFYDYIRILKEKKPLFFLAENVPGILLERHKEAFENILKEFEALWYNVTYKLLNANDYNVPQDRKRVIIVWYKKIIWKEFIAPKEHELKLTLKDAIFDLRWAKPAKDKNYPNDTVDLNFINHEYQIWGFSTMFMSRNRVRSWDEPSFTIQAWGRHAPLHPQAPKMHFVEQDKRIFAPGKEDLYRRLSVRECARIQTFPDDFVFKYKNVSDGYKMIWNAVPVEFWKSLAEVIYNDINEYLQSLYKVKKIKNNTYIEKKELVLS